MESGQHLEGWGHGCLRPSALGASETRGMSWMWSGTLPRPMQRSGHWLRGPQTLRHRPPFPGLLCGPGWQPALPGQLCPQTSCPGQPMGSPGGGWEGRRREGSGCFLVFSALASHDCRVCRVHPAPKLGLPASPAASSHLYENLRRHLSFLHGILLTATTPAGPGPKATLGKAGGLAAAQLPWTATLGNGRQ